MSRVGAFKEARLDRYVEGRRWEDQPRVVRCHFDLPQDQVFVDALAARQAKLLGEVALFAKPTLQLVRRVARDLVVVAVDSLLTPSYDVVRRFLSKKDLELIHF